MTATLIWQEAVGQAEDFLGSFAQSPVLAGLALIGVAVVLALGSRLAGYLYGFQRLRRQHGKGYSQTDIEAHTIRDISLERGASRKHASTLVERVETHFGEGPIPIGLCADCVKEPYCDKAVQSRRLDCLEKPGQDVHAGVSISHDAHKQVPQDPPAAPPVVLQAPAKRKAPRPFRLEAHKDKALRRGKGGVA